MLKDYTYLLHISIIYYLFKRTLFCSVNFKDLSVLVLIIKKASRSLFEKGKIKTNTDQSYIHYN